MKRHITPDSLFDSRPYGFSQIVIAEQPRQMVFISGQVAWDENMNIVGKYDLAVQTEKSILNLKTAMETAGGTLRDIVMLRIYKVNYQRVDGPVISRQLTKYFGTENAPASTWISVQGLANEDFMIEIEAQAVI
jgi:enamine deaminase RidA (YjgF/YER057c/UK114 family)